MPLSKAQLGRYYKQFFLFNLAFFTLQLIVFCGSCFGFIYAIDIPSSVYLVVIAEGILQVILYLMLSGTQTFWLWGIVTRLKNHSIINVNLIHAGIFFITILFLLSVNSYYFPLSRFSHFFKYEAPPAIVLFFSVITGIILAGLMINALISLTHRKMLALLCSSIIGMILFNHDAPIELKATKLNSSKYPHIFIIGVDSLNPNQVNQQEMPRLNALMKQSTQFTETISPLARTSAAWTSILTGLYPIHHHARENLMPIDHIRNEASIVWQLRDLGYTTLFASDDRRFNNLDENFGFETIIGPKIGVNDILLGNFYDFPLTNLLINLKISQWLFPYNYMNRASEYTYRPQTFDNELKSALHHAIKKNTPLFFAVHYTLPHWPYSWAESPPYSRIDDQLSVTQKDALYQAAVKRVDIQIAKLFDELQEQNLLSNSIIILLSDHGEALYRKGSRITALKQYQGKLPSPLAQYFKHHTSTTLNKSAGHGSDLLSPEQFHCLLGFQIYKNGQIANLATTIPTRVALIDIAPTLNEYLDQSKPVNKRHFDGISLLPTILKSDILLPERPFMLESGLLPNQFLTLKEAIYYGKLYYAVNPENDRLELKPEELSNIDATKLYGIIEGNWLLVLYPQKQGYLPVLVELDSQKWTDQMKSSFAKNSPMPNLMKELTSFYPNKLRHHAI